MKKPIFGPCDSYQLEPFEYPKAWTRYKDMRKNEWTPDEVPVATDVMNFKDPSTPKAVTEAFLSVMAQLTVFDLERGMDAADTFLHIVQPAEIKMALTRMIFEEAGHTQSYRFIIENFGLPVTGPDNFYDTWKRSPEMKARVEHSQAMSDRMMALYKPEKIDLRFVQEFLRATHFWFQQFEGMFFWINLLGPVQQMSDLGYYQGAAEQFRFIARDECVAAGTEVLTQDGWAPVESVSMDTVLAQWHPDNTLSWTTPVHVSAHLAQSYYEFYQPKSGFLQRVSENHRFPYWTKDGNLKVVPAKEATPNPYSKHPIAAPLRASLEQDSLTPLERFMVAFQADGHKLSDRYDGSRCGTRPATFAFAKDRKIARMYNLLADLGWEYSTSVSQERGPRREQVRFKVAVPLTSLPSKNLTDMFTLEGKTLSWCRDFIEEVAEWDGHRVSENLERIHYSSVVKSNSDFVQAVATLAGYKAKMSVQKDARSETFSNVYRIHIHKKLDTICGGKILKQKISEPIAMYGIQVPSSFIVIRDAGGVSITGNSQHIALGVDLWNWTVDQYPEAVDNSLIQTIQEDVEKAVTLEDAFIRFVFRYGPILGYSVADHIETTKWFANHRLRTAGLPTIYDNPKHAYQELFSRKMEIKQEGNFFEKRVKEYQTGAGLTFDDDDNEPGDESSPWDSPLGSMSGPSWSEEK